MNSISRPIGSLLQSQSRLFDRLFYCSIRDLKYRWGSCTAGGTLSFNWRILQAPMIVVNYLIVHELAHVLYRNHSTEFRNFVAVHVAILEKARMWLRQNGSKLEW